ncbi:MAG: hypothetical protein Ct9H300mP7_4290 [Verrucomicrobiota bacterium]|nr:MAG: hypothetical protein Ct9H300mP7_4290 [Verrucomicrobiota bacterium]
MTVMFMAPWMREKFSNGRKAGGKDPELLVRKTPDGEWLPLNQIEELSYICRQAAESPVPNHSTPLGPVAGPKRKNRKTRENTGHLH